MKEKRKRDRHNAWNRWEEKERKKKKVEACEREFGLIKWPLQFSTYLQKSAQQYYLKTKN